MLLSKTERTDVLRNHLANYEYLREGLFPTLAYLYFDVELFCFTLSACFLEDEVGNESLTPQNIYDLTMDLLPHYSQIN